jgi:hypothetical protein
MSAVTSFAEDSGEKRWPRFLILWTDANFKPNLKRSMIPTA